MINNLEHVVRKKFLNPEEVSSLVSIFSYAFDDIDAHKPHPNVAQFHSEQVVGSEVLSSVCRKIEAHFTDTLGVTDIFLAKC